MARQVIATSVAGAGLTRGPNSAGSTPGQRWHPEGPAGLPPPSAACAPPKHAHATKKAVNQTGVHIRPPES